MYGGLKNLFTIYFVQDQDSLNFDSWKQRKENKKL